MNELHFKAPWSPTLRMVTVAASIILGAMAVSVASQPEPSPAIKALIVGVIFPALAVNALFTIRGDALSREAVYVKRLFWWT